jgi:pyruvate dehydrogenase E2 component (dihydrolipoamide acetyltransferase)
MEAGTGADIAVGTPIMVTVEEQDDVAAFKDFVLEESAAAVAPPVSAAAGPAPAPAAAPLSPTAPAPAAPVAPTPVVEAAVPPPAMEDMLAAVAPVLSTGWGDFAKLNSPIVKTLSKQQAAYIEKYGTTGQVPL